MNPHLYTALETFLSSALGAGIASVGIWFLIFRARVEHLKALSAPSLARELKDVSEALDASAREKMGLQRQLGEIRGVLTRQTVSVGGSADGRRALHGEGESRARVAMEVRYLLGVAEGSLEARVRLVSELQQYIDAVTAGRRTMSAHTLFGANMRFMEGLAQFVMENIDAANSKLNRAGADIGS